MSVSHGAKLALAICVGLCALLIFVILIFSAVLKGTMDHKTAYEQTDSDSDAITMFLVYEKLDKIHILTKSLEDKLDILSDKMKDMEKSNTEAPKINDKASNK